MRGQPAPGALEAEAAWEAFWRRTSESSALAGRGPQDDVLAAYWDAFLGQALSGGARRRLVDLACGNGAVARRAAGFGPEASRPDVIAVDRSVAAVESLRRLAPSVLILACDALRTPFPDRCFDIVTSQFGIEYAGIAAFGEAARIVAPGGVFAAVLHLGGGAMYRENQANLEACRSLVDAGVLPALRELYHAHVRVRGGNGSRERVRQADANIQTAMARVDVTLRRLGPAVAGGMVNRLRSDVDHMRRRLEFHDPMQVVQWADLMEQELHAYGGRMSSMLDAAMDARGIDAVCALLSGEGISVRLRETTSLGRAAGDAAAWLLIGERA